MNDKHTVDFEPHIESKVNSSGMLYVGRKHTGKTAHIYFLKDSDD